MLAGCSSNNSAPVEDVDGTLTPGIMQSVGNSANSTWEPQVQQQQMPSDMMATPAAPQPQAQPVQSQPVQTQPTYQQPQPVAAPTPAPQPVTKPAAKKRFLKISLFHAIHKPMRLTIAKLIKVSIKATVILYVKAIQCS